MSASQTQRGLPECLSIDSLVSGRDRQPYVTLRWGKENGQLTPAEAVEHGRKVIEAAQAAITDAFLINFLIDRVGLSPPRAAAVLQDFRGYRKALEERGHA